MLRVLFVVRRRPYVIRATWFITRPATKLQDPPLAGFETAAVAAFASTRPARARAASGAG
jgi:hypothetical protein